MFNEKRLTRRFFVKSLKGLELSSPIIYERYYISDHVRIQKRDDVFEKEIISENGLTTKTKISQSDFDKLKELSGNCIVRESYLYLRDDRVSVKKYLGKYEGLIRAEVEFETKQEMDEYQKEAWMGAEITDTPLAFDGLLNGLDEREFRKLLEEYCQFSIE